MHHGVVTKGDAELLVHQVQLFLEAYQDWIVLKTDARNALNSKSRSHLLNKVTKLFPNIYDHVSKMYLGFNPMIFLQGSNPFNLSSQEGIHQGDPPGPCPIFTGYRILTSLQERIPDIRVLAYLDDVFLLGSGQQTWSCLPLVNLNCPSLKSVLKYQRGNGRQAGP